jgi:hypothetical protein
MCPICGKPDGCLVAEDGTACICSRISTGSVKKVGKGGFHGGWLHITGDFKSEPYKAPVKPYIDWAMWADKFAHNLVENRIDLLKFCADNKINPVSALRFNIGVSKGWVTIPMYGIAGKVTGIQRRQRNIKRFMKWSDVGVFIPSAFFQYRAKTLAVCEGWTDVIAAYEYGFSACIGKFNAWVGDEIVLYYAKLLGCERAFIFADYNEDGVGQDGAKQTEQVLCNDMDTKIIQCAQDLRACKLDGMTIREVISNG